MTIGPRSFSIEITSMHANTTSSQPLSRVEYGENIDYHLFINNTLLFTTCFCNFMKFFQTSRGLVQTKSNIETLHEISLMLATLIILVKPK